VCFPCNFCPNNKLHTTEGSQVSDYAYTYPLQSAMQRSSHRLCKPPVLPSLPITRHPRVRRLKSPDHLLVQLGGPLGLRDTARTDSVGLGNTDTEIQEADVRSALKSFKSN